MKLHLLLLGLLALPIQAESIVTQSLPITARVQLGHQTIGLEVARTPRQRAIGLMGRKDLPADRGMVFLFDPPAFVSFWMRNCLISLDMVFVRQGRIVNLTANAPPCTTAQPEQCPRYPVTGPVPADQVIELRAGQIQQLKLKVNDPVMVTFSKPAVSIIK
ncbi:DUF192 domain-containing protein [Candidatus Cyanaurora vandensis]|uniref:DUF192 domain-containing protein n=1 Tax=Candidatus Cyanaurora vandensis TaxID=2714958 RepID=UPI00257BC2A4|nr:DUF192 domain-containing protein [Candidatus Cyanaurora vandensis]